MAVQVIVVRCMLANRGGWKACGPPLCDTTFPTLEAAMAFGEPATGNGLCVIVRPNYNETDDAGKGFFREWRSFDGQALNEVRWNI